MLCYLIKYSWKLYTEKNHFSDTWVIKHNTYYKIWKRKWQPTPVLLPGKSHGQRSLVGYSPCGCKKSDTTEQLHFTHFILYHWRRKRQPTPVFLSGESHGQGNLLGCGPWSCREFDTTKVTEQEQIQNSILMLSFTFCIILL